MSFLRPFRRIRIVRVSHKARIPFSQKFRFPMPEVASRRDVPEREKAVEPSASKQASKRARALFLIPRRGITFDRPRNVRDKLHEHMPYDVTENGRMHLFSFPGHVTTASGTDIHYALPYTYIYTCMHACVRTCACAHTRAALCDIHPGSRSRLTMDKPRLPNDASNEPSL